MPVGDRQGERALPHSKLEKFLYLELCMHACLHGPALPVPTSTAALVCFHALAAIQKVSIHAADRSVTELRELGQVEQRSVAFKA